MNPYYWYQAWNKAFVDYYFSDNNGQALLYVDDSVIAEVGKSDPNIKKAIEAIAGDKEDAYVQHFLSYACPKMDWRRYFIKSKSDQDDKPTLANLIKRMIRISFSGDIRCLAFIIMILYLYQKGDDRGRQTEIAVKKHIKEYTGESFNDFSFIADAWNRIEKCDPSFISEQLADNSNQPYAGRLKYHLIVSKRIKDAFIHVLIDNQLRWDDQTESFDQFINNHVYQHLENELAKAISGPINNIYTRPIFESIVRNCDYSRTSSSNVIHKNLLFVYKRKNAGGVYLETLSLRIEDDDSRIIFYDKESLTATTNLNEEFEFKHTVPYRYFETQNLIEGIDNIGYSTIKKKTRFFLNHRNIEFVEVYEPENGYNYLVVFDDEVDTSIFDGQRPGDVHDVSKMISVFGGFQTYLVNNWRTPEHEVHENHTYVQQLFPALRDGITVHDKSHRIYISAALPYIEFKDPESARRCNIYVRSLNSNAGNEWRSYPARIDSKYLYLNQFIHTDFSSEHFLFEIQIKDDEQILFQKTLRVISKPYKARLTEAEYDEYGIYRQGNQKFPRASVSNSISHIYEGALDSTPVSNCTLYDILYQLADTDGHVSQSDLKRALRYVLHLENIEDDTKTRSNLIYSMAELGIISYSLGQDGAYHNYIRKPRLVKTQRRVGTNNFYLLTGCYTSDLLEKLRSPYEIELLYKKATPTDDPVLSILPPVVIINTKTQVTTDDLRKITGLDVSEHPVAFDIFQYMADLKECERIYLRRKDNIFIQQTEIKSAELPKISYDDGMVYFNWEENKRSWRSSYYYDVHMLKQRIPVSFMLNMVAKSKRAPIALLVPNSKSEQKKEHVFLSIGFAQKTGSLMNLALCELNLGLPMRTKCFVMNKENNVSLSLWDKAVYDEFVFYNLSVDNACTKTIMKKLTGEDIESWGDSPWVYIVRQVNNYKLFMKYENESFNGKYTLWLTYNNSGLAFVVYSKDSCTACYFESMNNKWMKLNSETLSVNSAISDLIQGIDLKRKYTLTEYSDVIPEFDEKQFERIKIINN